MEIITANSNPKIKEIRMINKDSAFRKTKGVFVVEGIRMFRELPLSRVKNIYLSESGIKKYSFDIEQMGLDLEDSKIIRVSDSVFSAISKTKSPQGVMATVECFSYSLEDIWVEKPAFIVLESMQDPGNMGTIFRTAEAVGITGIIIGGQSVDVYNPKTVRSTMGAIFRVPFICTDNLEQTIKELKRRGVVIFGAHLEGQNFYKEDYTGAVCFLIGNEGNGLTEDIAKTADRLIKIPMKGQVESLNAGTSFAVMGYEVLRQRENYR